MPATAVSRCAAACANARHACTSVGLHCNATRDVLSARTPAQDPRPGRHALRTATRPHAPTSVRAASCAPLDASVMPDPTPNRRAQIGGQHEHSVQRPVRLPEEEERQVWPRRAAQGLHRRLHGAAHGRQVGLHDRRDGHLVRCAHPNTPVPNTPQPSHSLRPSPFLSPSLYLSLSPPPPLRPHPHLHLGPDPHPPPPPSPRRHLGPPRRPDQREEGERRGRGAQGRQGRERRPRLLRPQHRHPLLRQRPLAAVDLQQISVRYQPELSVHAACTWVLVFSPRVCNPLVVVRGL